MGQTVAVDFDGVIHAYSKGWHDGTIYDEPMPGAIEGIKKLQERFAVFVFTSRDPGSVARWLCREGVMAVEDSAVEAFRGDDPGEGKRPVYEVQFWDSQELVLVTNRKLPAVVYIDDRAVPFTTWDQLHVQMGKCC